MQRISIGPIPEKKKKKKKKRWIMNSVRSYNKSKRLELNLAQIYLLFFLNG